VPKGIRRIARRQMEKILEELTNGAKTRPGAAVHDARKRFKMLRSVLRLVRAEIGNRVYRRENISFRDAARPLSELRDAQVLVDALDALTSHFADQVARGAFEDVRRALLANRREVRRRVLEEDQALAKVIALTEAALPRVKKWSFRHKGWPALSSGLEQVYSGGRQAFRAARAEPSVENLHEWRKQVKYLWHQLELLEPTWPAVMRELANQAHVLADCLGDDHDLATLRQFVTSKAEDFGDAAATETLVALIDRRRAELQQSAGPLGQRIYGEKPTAFVRRLEAYWNAWRRQGTVGDDGNGGVGIEDRE
jgi:CHAD domain-containing protein